MKTKMTFSFFTGVVCFMIMCTGSISNDRIILIADSCILAIPIIENLEPFIDLKDQSEIAYGPSPEIPNNPDYTKLRLTVYNKLKEAQKLLPSGLRFCIYEGYRSLTTQHMLFEKHYQQIRNTYLDWNDEQCFYETTRLVSPVTNNDGSMNIPPHSTGGAFDIYLIDKNGVAVDMGIHPENTFTDVSGEVCKTNSNKISQEAKKYRKIVCDALESVGFVNYPTEYWHWSYGDRYWAYHKQQSAAIYGSY
jgi:D-alanyl-D-alanine dipeptidase